jgi:hypothetical protein
MQLNGILFFLPLPITFLVDTFSDETLARIVSVQGAIALYVAVQKICSLACMLINFLGLELDEPTKRNRVKYLHHH